MSDNDFLVKPPGASAIIPMIMNEDMFAERDPSGKVLAQIINRRYDINSVHTTRTDITPEAGRTQVEVAKQNVEAVRARYENPVRIVMRYGLGFFITFMLFMGGMVVLAKVFALDPILTGVVLLLGAVVVVPTLGIIFTKFVGKILAEVLSGMSASK